MHSDDTDEKPTGHRGAALARAWRTDSSKGVSVTPPERALIHVYRGLGLTQQAAADQLDIHPRTVSHVLAESRDAVEAGADPVELWHDLLAALNAPPEEDA